MKQIVQKRPDIVFYIKMLPMRSLHPKAYDKSRSIVCKEPNEAAMALLEEVYDKKTIPAPDGDCGKKEIDANIDLAKKFGITGTPTMIFDDGARVKGSMAEEKLLELIDKH